MEQAAEHGTPLQYRHEMKTTGAACSACSDANRDYARSWRIRTGYTERVKVPVDLLRALVDCTDPEESSRLLVATVGPLTGTSILEKA